MSDEKHQMETDIDQLIDAATALKNAPASVYHDGMSAAEWYRSVLRRQKAIFAMRRAMSLVQGVLTDAENEAEHLARDAESMVLACVAVGDIK